MSYWTAVRLGLVIFCSLDLAGLVSSWSIVSYQATALQPSPSCPVAKSYNQQSPGSISALWQPRLSGDALAPCSFFFAPLDRSGGLSLPFD